MFGTKGDSGPQKLANSHNDFERGHTDEFFLKLPDLGCGCGKPVYSTEGCGARWRLNGVPLGSKGRLLTRPCFLSPPLPPLVSSNAS